MDVYCHKSAEIYGTEHLLQEIMQLMSATLCEIHDIIFISRPMLCIVSFMKIVGRVQLKHCCTETVATRRGEEGDN